MTKPNEEQPPSVPLGAKQGGEARARWAWVEPSVWSDRMLDALDNGVKGGKWFSLRDKLYAPANLAAAWARVQRNHGAAGVDGQSIARFGAQADRYLSELHHGLKNSSYEPQPVRRCWIPKAGTAKQRPLGIPTVKDRIVQTALRHVLEPIWEKMFSSQSYGFRPGRGCKDALRRVAELLKAGHFWVVDADIQSFFDTIDHGKMLAEIEATVSDGAVIDLVAKLLRQQVMEEMRTWTPERGTPQGATISPLFANIYLHPIDIALSGAGFEAVRYADDLVILCRNEQEARRALEVLQRALAERKLTLHPEKTRLVDVALPGGFDFLGYHFEHSGRTPRQKSLLKLRDSVRDYTRRNNGHSLERIIERINPVLRGWFQYFKHCHSWAFAPIDAWVRMRLRSISRRRHGGYGAGRGLSHMRWTNASFAKLGLFTMTTAWVEASQSR
jgi:RNA-directed DNA polymerase